MGSAAGVIQKEIQYPLDVVVLSLSNVEEYLLSAITDDPYNLFSVLGYTLGAVLILGLWYFLFWRTFNRNRVIIIVYFYCS